MNKTIILFCLILFLLAGCAPASVEDIPSGTEAQAATEIGSSSYSCITGISESQKVSLESITTFVQAFSHRVYDPNDEYLLTLTATVLGTTAEESAVLSDIQGTLSDAQADGFTVSTHISGDTGTIVLYRNQMSVCHFQYRIYPDGSITFL